MNLQFLLVVCFSVPEPLAVDLYGMTGQLVGDVVERVPGLTGHKAGHGEVLHYLHVAAAHCLETGSIGVPRVHLQEDGVEVPTCVKAYHTVGQTLIIPTLV